MTIKLIAADKEWLNTLLERVCNICCVAARCGNLPTERDIASSETRGLYWSRSRDKIDFYPRANDYKGFVIEEPETELTMKLHYRYDRPENSWEMAVGKLLFAIFENAHQFDRIEIVEQ